MRRFHPGSQILSVGSFGCNLSCPFCQNHEISMIGESDAAYREMQPEELADMAEQCKIYGNIGVAFTYNESLIGWEYVRDTARLIHARGMKNVLVTNGTAELSVLEEILPYMDAMNIDLKGFSEDYYQKLGGNLGTVKRFIERTAGRDANCHIELTTLIVPGENDSEEEMEQEARWIADMNPDIPLHVTRFFPRYKMTDRSAMDVEKIYRLKAVAGKYLKWVYAGNC
ncbi:MAG TPA: radical SAM protein [Candidatus Anaerobutyricum avicola]|nr:radical SAM protein [Candidatus Anaerobutyricum avicola]